MTANRNDKPPDGTVTRDAGLASIAEEYSGWFAWPGVVPPLLYARRPRTSPPLVVRSGTIDGLRVEIEKAERERGLR